MLDIFLARPDYLDGTIDLHGDLDRASDAVDLQPPAEAAADQVIVNHHLVQRQPGGFCPAVAWARARAWLPTQTSQAVLADMNGAVHRLHRRVREERNLVGRLDLGGGARHRAVDIAEILRDPARD